MNKSYNSENIFAKIIRGEIPSEKVYEDGDILAFNDISKAAPTHVLVIPKGEFVNLEDFVSRETSQKVAEFFQQVTKIAKDLDLGDKGYRIITNTGSDASQTVHHFHVHIIGGRSLGGFAIIKKCFGVKHFIKKQKK